MVEAFGRIGSIDDRQVRGLQPAAGRFEFDQCPIEIRTRQTGDLGRCGNLDPIHGDIMRTGL